jgi:4-amino-4-deoxy-L-arabinose transferase-like glycosyltransferase
MTLLIDSVLMLAGLLVWIRGSSEDDDVWSLFLRVFALVDLAVLVLGNGQLLIEIPLLLLALALPSVGRLERSRQSLR